MLDTPRTWRYQSAVLLGPRPKLPDQPNRGPEEGWGAPFEQPFARSVLKGLPIAENVDPLSLVTSPGNLKLARLAHAGPRLSTSVATHPSPDPPFVSGYGGTEVPLFGNLVLSCHPERAQRSTTKPTRSRKSSRGPTRDPAEEENRSTGGETAR